jgi:chromosomal replication initiation ATPase DnaA
MTFDPEAQPEVMEGVSFVARAPKLMAILETVCAVYLIGKMDLMSQRRVAHNVTARNAVYWIARHATPRTYCEIGMFMANRHHSTVIHGISQINRRLAKHKPKLREVCKRLGITIEELES